MVVGVVLVVVVVLLVLEAEVFHKAGGLKVRAPKTSQKIHQRSRKTPDPTNVKTRFASLETSNSWTLANYLFFLVVVIVVEIVRVMI